MKDFAKQFLWKFVLSYINHWPSICFQVSTQKLFNLLIMAYASDIDVVQEAFKIFPSSDVVVERLGIFDVVECFGIFYEVERLGIFGDKLEIVCLKMEYRECKVDSNNNRLKKPQANKDATC